MIFLKQQLLNILFVMALLGSSFPARAQVNAFEDPPSGAATVQGAQEFGPRKADMDGGDVPLGQTNQVIVLLRNNTSKPITPGEVKLSTFSTVSAMIISDQCTSNTVRAGEECAITVAVKGEAQGKYRVGMLVDYKGGNSMISSVSINGNVTSLSGLSGGMPANEIEPFPNMLDFATAKGRTPLVRSIVLRNSSTNSVEINGIDLAASPLTGFSVSAPNCKMLAPSQSCVATVTWTPSIEGKAEGVLVLRHSGPSGSLQIPLVGDYQRVKTEKAERFPSPVSGMGLIIADRESIDFGSGVDGAASITVSLINTGDKAVTLNQVKLAGSDNGLSLSSDDCATGKVLEPNEGCALTVNWAARRKGPVIDDIQIIHDGARGVLVLPVRGIAAETANLILPVFKGSTTLPKLRGSDLDENLVQNASIGDSSRNFGLSGGDANSLNGYRVTSLSANSAVIAGPRGRVIINDGIRQIIAGGQWTPKVVPDGVELHGGKDTVLLFFDRSLGVINVSSNRSIMSNSEPGESAPAP